MTRGAQPVEGGVIFFCQLFDRSWRPKIFSMKYFWEKSYNIAVSKNRPTSLIHFVTNRCNARCPHCFIDFDDLKSQKAQMNLQDIDKMTRTIGRQLMNVNFTGGEPFLNRNLKQICHLYLENTAIDSMFFSTNGGFPQKVAELASELSAAYPKVVFTFSISIDDIGDRHSQYRKSTMLYEKAMMTYRKIQTLGRNVQGNITLTVSPHNAARIKDIFDHLHSIENVRSLTATIVRDEGVYKVAPERAAETLRAYKELVSLIHKHDLFYEDSGYLSRMMNEKEKKLYRYIEKAYLQPRFQLPCTAGGLLGVIYPNGDVFPCEVLGKKMGNLYDHDMNISRLWGKNTELRKWIKDTKCNCSYECAWSYNILSSPKHMLQLGVRGIV